MIAGFTEWWDAIIIGGGPAGSTAASMLATGKRRVLLLEAENFPRHHVGESLVQVWSLLRRLDIADVMDATMTHKYGSTRVWGKHLTPRTTYFIQPDVPWTDEYSLQVERGLFDDILLNRAQELGATVCHGHRAMEVIWEGDRAVGVRYRRPDGSLQDSRSRVVIDASGRVCMIARRLKTHHRDPFFPDLSVYAYFRNTRLFPGRDAGNLYLGAAPKGWFWFIPLHTGEVSVGLVCDTTSRAELRAKGLRQFLLDAISESPSVRDMVARGEISRGPMATASYGYCSTRSAGPGWFLAGDAGNFVDPMWAMGVNYALMEGARSAALTMQVLTGQMTEEAAIEDYNAMVSLRHNTTTRMIKLVYASNRLYADQPFWRARHALLGEAFPLTDDDLLLIGGDLMFHYFRQAFAGMGLDEDRLRRLDDAHEQAKTERALGLRNRFVMVA